MIPGLVSKASESVIASAATIRPKTDITFLTGTTAVSNIIPPFGGFSGILVIIPVDGNVVMQDTGNIMIAVNLLQNIGAVFAFSKTRNKWFTPVQS